MYTPCAMKRLLAMLVSVCLVMTCSPAARAGVVTTQQAIEQQLLSSGQASLVSALERQDVRQQLVGLGVDPENAKLRIASLSDAQVAELQRAMNDLPAGGGVLEVVVAVLLVLLILDLVGVTNIFSFIK